MAVWDARDQEFNLRTKMAKLIAAKISGVDPEKVTPTQDDFDMADDFARTINHRNE